MAPPTMIQVWISFKGHVIPSATSCVQVWISFKGHVIPSATSCAFFDFPPWILFLQARKQPEASAPSSTEHNMNNGCT